MKRETWASLFNAIFIACSSMLLLNYIFLPAVPLPRLAKYSGFILFALALGTYVSYLLSKIYLIEGKKDRYPDASPRPKYVTAIGLIGIAAIGVQLFLQFNAPLHWEDHFHLSNVLTDPWERFNPLLRTEHHVLTNIATFLSISAFGASKFAIKFPALIFTALFLTTLLVFCRRYLSAVATGILFFHLAANQMALWYFHSMRGYILAMLLTLCALSIFWEATNGKPKRERTRLIQFAGLCWLSSVTHLFATLYCVMLFLTLVSWLYVNRETVERARLAYCLKLIQVFLFAVVPVFLFILFHQAMWLEKLGDFFKGGFPDVSMTLLSTLGSSYIWVGRLLLVGLALLVTRFWQSARTPGFSGLFLTISGIFFACVLGILQVRLLETRFILPFLTPFLIWIVYSISNIDDRRQRVAGFAVTALVFILVPLKGAAGFYDTLTLNVRDYESFIHRVVAVTSPVERNCYTYEGEPNLIYFTRTLYLGPRQGVTHSGVCQGHYHIYFETPPELPAVDTRKPEEHFAYQPLINIENRFVLYRAITPEVPLAGN